MCHINQLFYYSEVDAKTGLLEYIKEDLNPALGFPMVHKRMSTFVHFIKPETWKFLLSILFLLLNICFLNILVFQRNFRITAWRFSTVHQWTSY